MDSYFFVHIFLMMRHVSSQSSSLPNAEPSAQASNSPEPRNTCNQSRQEDLEDSGPAAKKIRLTLPRSKLDKKK